MTDLETKTFGDMDIGHDGTHVSAAIFDRGNGTAAMGTAAQAREWARALLAAADAVDPQGDAVANIGSPARHREPGHPREPSCDARCVNDALDPPVRDGAPARGAHTIEITLEHGRVTYIDGADTYPCQVCGKALRVGDLAIFCGPRNGTGVCCTIPIPGHKNGAHRLCRAPEVGQGAPREIESPETMGSRLVPSLTFRDHATHMDWVRTLRDAIRARDEQIAAWAEHHGFTAGREGDEQMTAYDLSTIDSNGLSNTALRDCAMYCEGQASVFRCVAAKLREVER